MVDFQLDEMQEMLKELAHEFAVEEIRPNAEHWDLILSIQKMRLMLHMKWAC